MGTIILFKIKRVWFTCCLMVLIMNSFGQIFLGIDDMEIHYKSYIENLSRGQFISEFVSQSDMETWNPISNSWNTRQKIIIRWNSKGKPTSIGYYTAGDRPMISIDTMAYNDYDSIVFKEKRFEYYGESSSKVVNYREIVNYDSFGKILSKEEFEWDKNKKNIKPIYKETFIYNKNDLLIEKNILEKVYEKKECPDSNNFCKEIYFYDSINQLIKLENFKWDTLRKRLQPDSRRTYEYNKGILKQETLEKKFNYSNFIFFAKYVYEYSEDSLCKYTNRYSWNKSKDEWNLMELKRERRNANGDKKCIVVLKSKLDSIYNEGDKTIELKAEWDNEINQWSPYLKEIKTYDNNKLMEYEVLSRGTFWEERKDKIKSQSKNEYFYNEKKVLTSLNRYFYNQNTNNWDIKYRVTFKIL